MSYSAGRGPPDFLSNDEQHRPNLDTPYVSMETGQGYLSQIASNIVPQSAPVLVSGDAATVPRKHITAYVSMEIGASTVPPVYHVDEDDSHSISPSILSSVATADGIHDVTGFSIVCLVILIGDMSRGVMFPTMWPLVESLGGTTVTLGYAVAAFSFGRILVNPLFGAWSISIGYSKTLLLSCLVLLLGTLCYAQVQNVGRVEFLIVAQTILGIGSGTLGVTRAFVADVTAKRNRTTYMAWSTAVQYAGFTVTPFVGALFCKILGDRDYNVGLLRLNKYTAPAYFMTVICIITMIFLFLFFKDRQRIKTVKDKRKLNAQQSAIADVALSKTFLGLSTYDACILGCMLLNISTKGSIAAFETLGISYAETHFQMDSSRAATIVAACGSVGVVSLLCMGKLATIITDIQLICGGMIVMCFGIISLTSLDEDGDNSSWRYVFAFFMMYSIGYPIGHTAVIGLFSKIIGRRPQGVLLGWFASAGSLARMIFPIVSGYIANYSNVSYVFWLLFTILTISTIFVLVSQNKLTLLSS